jgi:CBS-domain-containing membrane protein
MRNDTFSVLGYVVGALEAGADALLLSQTPSSSLLISSPHGFTATVVFIVPASGKSKERYM